MRWSTLCFAVISVVVGIILFRVKYEVDSLENKHRTIRKSIQETKESIHVLRAEWAHLNDPSRIQTLSAKYLKDIPLEKAEDLEETLKSVIHPEELKKNDGIKTVSHKEKLSDPLDLLLDEVATPSKKVQKVNWGKKG